MQHHRYVFDRINEFADRIGKCHDDLIRAHAAQYVCVMASGALESACVAILSRYADVSGNSQVARHIKSNLKQFQNPKPEKIIKLLETFDGAWVVELERFWAGSRKDAVGSIVANKNQISHGKPTNVTLGQVSPWLKGANEFCDKLEEIVMRR